MRRWAVFLAFGEWRRSYLLRARSLEHAAKAARSYRLPGIEMVAIKPLDLGEDEDDAPPNLRRR